MTFSDFLGKDFCRIRDSTDFDYAITDLRIRNLPTFSQYLYFSFQQLRKYFRSSFSRGLFCGS